MKHLIFCLLISVNLLNAQIDDKFISLDNDSNYSFNSAFNEKYQLFPQIKDIYQGFIVKPFERQGCYAWLQLKQNGSLRDTIVWLEAGDSQSLLKRLPFTAKNPESILHYNDLINRAKYLSVEHARSKMALTKEYDETINGSLVRDTTIRFNSDYEDEKALRQRNLMDPRWTFTTSDMKLEKFSIIGKSGNDLIIHKDDDYKAIRIKEIQNIKFKAPNQAWLGLLVGIPLGGLVGYGVGTLLVHPSHGYFDFSELAYVGTSIVGAAVFGAGGAILMSQLSKRPDIEIQGETEYDRYFDFDRKTFFAIPEIKVDSSVLSKILIDSNIQKNASNHIYSIKDSTKPKVRPVDTTMVSFGIGIVDPILVNVHFQYFIDENIGVLYTGFPLALEMNNNQESNNFGIFYRIYHNYKFRHNVGLSVGFGKAKNEYYYGTLPEYSNYIYAGAFYEISYYGFYGMTGLYFKVNNSNSDNSFARELDNSPFRMQIGYRFTI